MSMREERGSLAGDQTIREAYTLWGSVAGDVKATTGSKFYLRGSIFGSLIVEAGGRVHIFGHISRDVRISGLKSKVIISGTIGGDVINDGGRVFIDANAHVRGKVKTSDGETVVEPQAKVGN
jgi:UDP-N-acetylenolpyruvoylglucosamine reductase